MPTQHRCMPHPKRSARVSLTRRHAGEWRELIRSDKSRSCNQLRTCLRQNSRKALKQHAKRQRERERESDSKTERESCRRVENAREANQAKSHCIVKRRRRVHEMPQTADCLVVPCDGPRGVCALNPAHTDRQRQRHTQAVGSGSLAG